MSSSPTFLDPLILSLVKGETILDLGCGFGRWGALLTSNFWEAGMTKPPLVDGIDAFPANIEYCRTRSNYRELHCLLLPCELPGRWDTVLAADIIEHLPQDDTDAFLDRAEAAATRRVIVTTPNWPSYRPAHATPAGYNDYEAHLSYVSRASLRARGYKVLGAGFGNPGNPTGKMGRGVRKLIPRASQLANGVATLVPWTAEAIVAYKDI